MSARARHEQISAWGAAAIAISIDRGMIDHWPFEVTRQGAKVLRRGYAVEREESHDANRQGEGVGN